MTNNECEIHKAVAGDAKALMPLFKGYIEFYGVTPPSDEKLIQFIEMICQDEAKGCIFLSKCQGEVTGFVTLYKTYSSFQLKEALILNDLYVLPSSRKNGAATKLFTAAKNYCLEGGYAYMEWMTAPDNIPAINFYLKNKAKKADWLVFSL